MANRTKGHRLRIPTGFSRGSFRACASKLGVQVGGQPLGDLIPREHSTGSLGWSLNQKVQVKVGECLVWVQANVTFTVCGSKDLPREGG